MQSQDGNDVLSLRDTRMPLQSEWTRERVGGGSRRVVSISMAVPFFFKRPLRRFASKFYRKSQSQARPRLGKYRPALSLQLQLSREFMLGLPVTIWQHQHLSLPPERVTRAFSQLQLPALFPCLKYLSTSSFPTSLSSDTTSLSRCPCSEHLSTLRFAPLPHQSLSYVYR